MKTALLAVTAALTMACGAAAPATPTQAPSTQAPTTTESSADVDPWRDVELLPLPEPIAPSSLELPPSRTITLANGLEILLIESPDAPMLRLQLAIRAGRAQAPADRSGIEEVVAREITRMAPSTAALASRAGTLQASTGRQVTIVSCSSLPPIDACASAILEASTRPQWDTASLETHRDRLHAELEQGASAAEMLADTHIDHLLWGSADARGRPMTAQSLDAITLKDLRSWHGKHFVPGNAVLLAIGSFDGETVEESLRSIFGAWRKGAVPRARPPVAPRSGDGLRVRIVDQPDTGLAELRIAHPSLPFGHEGAAHALVLNDILGGGPHARLAALQSASEQPAVFAMRSLLDRGNPHELGSLLVRARVRPEVAAAVAGRVLEEMAKLQISGPSKVEVVSSVVRLAGSYAIGLTSPFAIGRALLLARLSGYDQRFIRDFPEQLAGVRATRAREVAGELFHPKDAAVVIVGNAELILPAIERLGWRHEVVSGLEPVGETERQRAAPTTAPRRNDPKATALVGRAIKAKGARLPKLRSLEISGSMTMQSRGTVQRGAMHKTYAAPDRMRMDIEFGAHKLSSALVGARGWKAREAAAGEKPGSSTPERTTLDLPPAELGLMSAQLWRDADLILLRTREPGVRSARGQSVELGGAVHDTVHIYPADGTPAVTLYLDRDTHLLRQIAYFENGLRTTETYSQYKRHKGIAIAHRRVIRNARGSFTIEILSVSIDTPLEDARFLKPE